MANALKVVFFGGAAVAAAAFAVNSGRLYNAADKLDVLLIKSEIDRGLKLAEVLQAPLNFRVKFRFTLKFKNPTGAGLSFSKPYVKALYNGTVTATSTEASSYMVNIPAHGSQEMLIELEMASADMIAVMPDFAKYLAGKFLGDNSAQRAMVLNLTTDVVGAGTITFDLPYTI